MVTGGAGFVGSAFCRHLVRATDADVVVVDKLTYAGSLGALEDLLHGERLRFEQADICDGLAMAAVLDRHGPAAIVHLAAETHVDRSIDDSRPFVETNVVGTHSLLEAARRHCLTLDAAARDRFRFVHVSTDEVYGSIEAPRTCSEASAYDPRSPYAASKAASDHLVRAWGSTYGLPVILSHCTNNYGPYQFPEKLIPLMVIKALRGEPLPLYGSGRNVRDWLHVDDHARALHLVLTRGRVGERYLIGTRAERSNLEVVESLCRCLDRLAPRGDGRPHASAIAFVADRPGHDLRYAVDPRKIETELGWRPSIGFAEGLEETVAWLIAHGAWWQPILAERYGGERLGLAAPPDRRART
jgi:dTDP-glucose 4,6-dehydratase